MSFILNNEGYYDFKKQDNRVVRAKEIETHEWFYSAELLSDLVSHFQEEELALAQLAELGGVQGIAFALRTDQRYGIASDELLKWDMAYALRSEQYGKNEITRHPPTPFIKLCINELEDFMLRILIVCAIVSITVGLIFELEEGGYIDGFAILIAVTVVVLVGGLNNYQKEKQFRAMEQESEQKTTIVLRNNKEQEISFQECIVGDLVVLRAGYTIPCDGVFVFGTDNFKTDEASLTGESKEIKKNRFHPLLMAGTHVSQGDGLMLAVAVGDRTQWGQLMAGLQEERKETPLQIKLNKLGEQIGYIGMGVALILFLILIISWLIRNSNNITGEHLLEEIIDAAIVAVTIVVVAVPEGLPLAVTISLAYSMKKMLLDNNFVRHLAACETMGNATAICSDKTGTLTQNKMSVDKVFLCNKEWMNNLPERNDLSNNVYDIITHSLCINSKAFQEETKDVQKLELISSGKAKPKLVGGNQTECALLQWAIDLGSNNYKEIRSNNPVTKYYPFDSHVKRSSVFLKLKNKISEQKYIMYTKGAAEQVLSLCKYYMDLNGNPIELSDNDRNSITNAMIRMTKTGLRCLGVCYREYNRNECPWTQDNKSLIEEDDFMFEDMVWICCAGIKDPVRPEVPNAVKTCQDAGIIVRMVTGDHLETAKHIASECGILSCDEHICKTGIEFRNMTDEERKLTLPMLRVLARSKPQDKEDLVRWYMANGDVVAVTGDGANDALALKEADVGLSMGIQGTDVAKEASDVVILDDNFASIEKTVMWGRSVYDNIRKFVQFQLTVNVVALVFSLIAAFWTEFQSPLTAVQLLWVNLIMDTMAALALATEKPTVKLLERFPFAKDAHLINQVLWRFIFGHSTFQLTALLLTMFYAKNWLDINPQNDPNGQNRTHLTVIFNTFVWLQIFNEINARRVNNEFNVFERFFENMYFIVIIVVTVALQVFIVEVGGEFTSTVPLNLKEWGYCIGVGALSIPVHQIIRFIPVNLNDGLIEVDIKTVFKSQEKYKRTIKTSNKSNGDVAVTIGH